MSERQVPPGLRTTRSTGGSGDGSIPPGFDKNPTAWPRRILLAVIAFAGFLRLGLSGAFPDRGAPERLGPVLSRAPRYLNTSASRTRPSGRWPTATEVVLTFIGGTARWRTAPWTVLAFGFVICSGALVSVLLIGMQAFLVGAWCTLCLTSAAISFAIFALGIEEPLAGIKHLLKGAGKAAHVWGALWGLEDTDKKGRS